MQVVLNAPKNVTGNITLPLSKSVCNRLLIMRALAQANEIPISIAESTDSIVLNNELDNNSLICNVNDAGTAFRFLTAYFASNKNITSKVITGSPRLRERPIAPLVDALQQIGADITYLDKPGFAPIQITGKQLQGGNISIDASISSQFISALCMIAPTCTNGLCITLNGDVSSESYIDLTLQLMQQQGISFTQENSTITIPQQAYLYKEQAVETDWSAASFFLCAALISSCNFKLLGLNAQSKQGDAQLLNYLINCGASAAFNEQTLSYQAANKIILEEKTYDFKTMPDAAVPFIAMAAIYNPQVSITGIESLRIKECDRIEALTHELLKCNREFQYKDNILRFKVIGDLPKQVSFNTYNDHRIAMSLALLSLVIPKVTLNDPDCVAKSYPLFWQALASLGWQVQRD